MEVLRRHSNNYGAVERVGRLTRHLAKTPCVEALTIPRSRYQPKKLTHRLSDGEVAALLTAYRNGATTRAVGEQFGLAHSSVNKLLQQNGVIARRRSPTPADLARAKAMYGKGQSTLDIAKGLGFGASTIQRALRRAGVQLRPRSKTTISDKT